MNLGRKRILDYYIGGILILVLRPLVFVVGRILRLDHSPIARRRICFIKMLGGGSLLIALPALLGIRRRYPTLKISLITTKSVRPFAETLKGIFDEILIIDDSSFLRGVASTLVTMVRAWGTDTVIDFEVYSRFTTILSVLILARNRIGFYLESVFFRKYFCNYLLFFNRFSGSYCFYEKTALLIDATPAPFEQCQAYIRRLFPDRGRQRASSKPSIVIGAGCSELGRERMLNWRQWKLLIEKMFDKDEEGQIILLGGASDIPRSKEIIGALSATYPKMVFRNYCGRLSLMDSLKVLANASEYIGIDSALLHYARLLGVNCVSVWGPTDPKTRLKPCRGLRETVLYSKLSCSPCIHVTEVPPCNGAALCIERLFASKKVEIKSHPQSWVSFNDFMSIQVTWETTQLAVSSRETECLDEIQRVRPEPFGSDACLPMIQDTVYS